MQMEGRNLLKLACASVAALTATAHVSASAAPTATEEGFITFASGGWVNPSMLVRLGVTSFTNPASCPATDGYLTDPADPGHELFNSMLLSAYLAKRRVQLTIDGCTVGRPRIIAVAILPD